MTFEPVYLLYLIGAAVAGFGFYAKHKLQQSLEAEKLQAAGDKMRSTMMSYRNVVLSEQPVEFGLGNVIVRGYGAKTRTWRLPTPKIGS